MEKKKSNLLVTILVIIIIGLVGFILYDKGLLIKEDSVEKNEKVEEVTEGRDFNVAVAKEILDKFNISSASVDTYTDNIIVKFDAAIRNLNKNNYMSYSCDDLLADEKSTWEDYGGDGYFKTVGTFPYYCANDVYYTLYSFDDVNAKYDEMFEANIEKKNYSVFYYLSKKNGFAELVYGDGTSGPTIYIDEVKSANLKDNELTINAYMEVIVAEDDTHFKVGNNTFEYDMNDYKTVEKVEKEIIENHLEDVNKYEIKFKIKNDRYVFKSIKKI